MFLPKRYSGDIERIYEKDDFKKSCPNCAAPIEGEVCPYCGTVFVDFACIDTEKPFFLKIKRDGKITIMKVRLNHIEKEADCCTVFADNVPYCSLSPVEELTLNFDILKWEEEENE